MFVVKNKGNGGIIIYIILIVKWPKFLALSSAAYKNSFFDAHLCDSILLDMS
jgi:hypothetical protein